jgi:3-hydroxyisobutyrate dehydrogenase-like beta-hydroxyacid dehydrogenase
MHVTLIGLGIMDACMARHWTKNDYTFVLHDMLSVKGPR